jgi:CRISPR-associated exonuclease Cas4
VTDSVALSDLALAAFCPRKLYYARERDRTPPPEHDTAVELAFSYRDILAQGPSAVADRDIGVDPGVLVSNLESARDRLDAWEPLQSPAAREAFLAGKDVHGVVTKVLEAPLAPTIVSPGQPPPDGVWQPQAVRAMGAAKALAWERETPVERAFVEYPRFGEVRRVASTTRRRAEYRRTLRTVRAIDGPPPRLGNDAKCESCRFAGECGVRTRSLRSLL